MALTSSSSNSGGGEPSVTTTTAPLSSTPARGRYLSARGLQRLKDYKYVSAPLSSYIDQKMTHFWEFTVNLMPMWLAPNLVRIEPVQHEQITTFSFAHAWMAHLVISYYSPNLSEQAPRWAYVFVAVAMFLYQTLDAIDGKQIMGIFVAATVQAGPTLLSYVLMCMVVVPFFAANWEESCTSVFRFGMVGVTEGQFIVMGVELLTGLVGPNLWSMRVFPDLMGVDLAPTLTIHNAVIGLSCLGGAYQVLSSLWEVRNYYRAHPQEDRTQAVVSLAQFTCGVLLGLLWVVAPSGAMLLHPRTLLSVIGALCSYQASRLIICHTTDEHYSRFWAIMWPLPIVVLNEWSGRLFNGGDTKLWADSTTVAYAYAAYVVALYVHFVMVTINQITSFLGIRCFVIKHVDQDADKRK